MLERLMSLHLQAHLSRSSSMHDFSFTESSPRLVVGNREFISSVDS